METELKSFRDRTGNSSESLEINTTDLEPSFNFSADWRAGNIEFLLFHPEGHQIFQSLIEAAPGSSRRAA